MSAMATLGLQFHSQIQPSMGWSGGGGVVLFSKHLAQNSTTFYARTAVALAKSTIACACFAPTCFLLHWLCCQVSQSPSSQSGSRSPATITPSSLTCD